MGRTKRKISKKKKSKISSEIRRKKMSRRNKSKRLCHHSDSESSYSDESSRSLSLSLSDSEVDYKNRKGRSHVRGSTKRRRKRAPRSSSSRDSSVDSPRARKRKRARSSSSSRDSSVDSGRVKKRKRSRRNGDSKTSKRMQKKKLRRKASVSSSSSDSYECSGSKGSEFGRMRGRSREKKRNKRSSGNARSGTEKIKMTSRSLSSCSRCSDSSDDLRNENVMDEMYPRRLRSVITVPKPLHENEETGGIEDEHKEEMFYDQDDYPSCRSNDSNNEGGKDLAYHTYVASKKRRVENLKREEDLVSNLTSKDSELGVGDRSDDLAEINPHGDGGRVKKFVKENKSDAFATSAAGSDDLEIVLRQKALENLMRFRGGPKTNVESPSRHENTTESDIKLSSAKIDFVPNKPVEQELSHGVNATQSGDQRASHTTRKGSSCIMQTDGKELDGIDNRTGSKDTKHGVVNRSAHVTSNKFESTTSALMQQSSGSGFSLKQVPPSHVSLMATSPTAKNIINKTESEASETVAGGSSNNQSAGVIDACVHAPEPSCGKRTSEEDSSSKQQDESKANSQFEQKTMSVMSGGEMVQLSYKVYIPKKAPALARRRQQR